MERRLRERRTQLELTGNLAEMPFPPMLVNGPHYHAPMNITVQSQTNLKPHQINDPTVMQLEVMTKHDNDLTALFEQVKPLEGLFESMRTSIMGGSDTALKAVEEKLEV
jgi:hypothetical protein